MSSLRHLLSTGILLCLVVVSAARAADPAGSTLSYVEQRENAYRWTYRSPDGHETELYRGPRRPAHFFWGADGRTVLFLAGGELKRAALGSELETLGSAPGSFGDIQALWIDRSTSRIRLAAMAPVAARDVLRTGGRVEYRSGDGQRVAGLARPSWGLPFIVTVLEQDPADRHWSIVARKGTKSSAGDTPGLSVIDGERAPAGTAIEDLLASYTCESGQCRADVTQALATAVSRAVSRKVGPDDLSLWRPPGSATTIVFRTVMGDVAHMTTPVLLLRGGDPVPKPVAPADGRQIGLAPAGGALLIGDEFTGAHPALIDLETARSVWSNGSATDAVWVPTAH